MQNTRYQSLWDGTEAVVPFAALTPESVALARASWVGAGGDCRGERAGLGITSIDCKVAPQDTNGALFVIELAIQEKGGPARHLHYEQEEWFYVVEGEFVIVKPVQFLKEEWEDINEVVRSCGGRWVKGDIISYWEIPAQ